MENIISQPNNNFINHLLKPEDVTSILNISLSFTYQLIQQGELPSIHIGRSVRIRPQDLENFINSRISTVSKSF